MAQWEVHSLRGLVSNWRSLVILHRRAMAKYPLTAVLAERLDQLFREMLTNHQENQRRALFDQEFRTRPLRGVGLP